MLERLIIFVVLGAFVFAPTPAGWPAAGIGSWLVSYLPWIVVILAVVWTERPQNTG